MSIPILSHLTRRALSLPLSRSSINLAAQLTMVRKTSTTKRERSPTSSLSPTDTESPPPKRPARAASSKKSTASTTSTATKGKGKPLTKSSSSVSRKSLTGKFPPPALDAPYPSRLGLPAYKTQPAPAVSKEHGGNGVNGGIPPKGGLDGLPLLVGAHVSMAGGPATALLRSRKLGANGVALFVKGHRAWKSKDLEEEQVEQFRAMMRSEDEGGESSMGARMGGRHVEGLTTGMGYGPESILVHGNYLINLGYVSCLLRRVLTTETPTSTPW